MKKERLQKMVIAVFFTITLIVCSSTATLAYINCGSWISGHIGITNPNKVGMQTIDWLAIMDYNFCVAKPGWFGHIEFGRNEFEIEDINESIYWLNISASIRYYFEMSNFNPFVSIGPGYYIPNDGDNKFGAQIGFGIDYSLSDRFVLELGADFHNIFLGEGNKSNNDSMFSFQTFQLGILFRFK